jgi:hypothetical protein
MFVDQGMQLHLSWTASDNVIFGCRLCKLNPRFARVGAVATWLSITNGDKCVTRRLSVDGHMYRLFLLLDVSYCRILVRALDPHLDGCSKIKPMLQKREI